MQVIRADLATSIGLHQPLSLTELVRHFDQPEIRTVQADLDADALHGATEFVMRSDGTYTFRGHLRATGFPSFAYKVQASVRCAAGVVIVVEAKGRVFGTDTPGDRQRDWSEDGTSPVIQSYWAALRTQPRLETDLQKNLSGVGGALVDVAKTVVETYVAAQFSGVVGAVIVLGGELGAATGVAIENPKILAGVTVGSAMLMVFGPSAIIPAVIAGSAVALLTDIKFRPMLREEVELAVTVFGNSLPIERIVLTNLCNPTNTAKGFLAREFTMPGIADGKILVNLGKNFAQPLGADHPDNAKVRGASYARPGQLLIHELMHAWQIHHLSFVSLLCKALVSEDYRYDEVKVREHADWSDAFDLEAQAAIIDRWYGTHPDLGGFDALNDDRFFYVSRHVRVG